MPPLGVGIIDTSSLWASGSLLYKEPVADVTGDYVADFLRHPNRELYNTKQQYFLSLLHNILLYDELRTDIDILSTESKGYYEPVLELLKNLSSVVKVDTIPQTFTDQDIIEAIAPAFVEKTRNELQSERLSAGSAQIAVAAASFHGFYYSDGVLGGEQLDAKIDALSPNTRHALFQLAYGNLGADLAKIVHQHSKLSAIYRNLSIIARTVRYVSHSRSVHTMEKRPSAFCASPRRIELLQGYLDSEYLKSVRAGAEGFVDLFSKLGLPTSGYDFAGFAATVKPISLTDLSYSISKLPPREALNRVLEIRQTPEALTIRRIWAERLWRRDTHALEGYAQPISAAMRNIKADGDVIQIIAIETGDKTTSDEDTLTSKDDIGIRDLVRRVQASFRGKIT